MSASKSSAALWLCVVFGGLYFVQGIAEPTEGLIAQPIRSLQHDWGRTPEEIALFAMLIGLPWTVKPLFGLLIDFVPLWGLGQRGYLLICTLLTSLACALLFGMRDELQTSVWLLPLMLCATTSVAISDVAVDALMVRHGQPLGLTGRLQSVQWSCMYAATIIAGPLGGELSQRRLQGWGFAAAGLLAGGSFLVLLFWRPQTAGEESADAADSLASPQGPQDAPDSVTDHPLADSGHSYSLWGTIIFLMLWNFSPFSSSVQYSFMKDHLKMDDRFIGLTTSAFAFGALFASIAYGTYCRSVPFRRLLQMAVVAGSISTLAYLGMVGQTSAICVSLLSGVTYMTGTMIQLDLAARACPPRYAGTIFSGMMAASNVSILISTYIGGWALGNLLHATSPHAAFSLLVMAGASTTACCFLLINRLDRVSSKSPSFRPLHS